MEPVRLLFHMFLWIWRCTTFNSILIILTILSNKKVALIYYVTICQKKTKDCTPSRSFQHELHYYCFYIWCLLPYITSLLYQLWWDVLLLRFKEDVSIRKRFSFSFSDLRYTSFERASLELSKVKLGSEAEGNNTNEMNYLSLDLNAVSFVLYFSASEPSVNLSYSKLPKNLLTFDILNWENSNSANSFFSVPVADVVA